jgi:DnaJ-class molecular chaperone
VKVCREILRCKDYYEVLAVKRDFTEDDLKKAYRKRAIKVHPDKNAAPMATDAFKKVSAAMACLSDATKRR